MRGHQALIAMRRRGYIPDCVWIDTETDSLPMADDWSQFDNSQARLQLEAEDKPGRLDLRLLHGLKCYVQGNDATAVRAMRDACMAAGAKRVIATVTEQMGRDEFVAFRVVEMTDTEGVHDWIQNLETIDG